MNYKSIRPTNTQKVDNFLISLNWKKKQTDISVLGPPGVTSNIGSLNPDLYKSPLIPEEDTSNYPEGHLGRFWFSLNYDQEQEKLIINLIRIHNLPSRDKDTGSGCDPLVRYISLF